MEHMKFDVDDIDIIDENIKLSEHIPNPLDAENLIEKKVLSIPSKYIGKILKFFMEKAFLNEGGIYTTFYLLRKSNPEYRITVRKLASNQCIPHYTLYELLDIGKGAKDLLAIRNILSINPRHTSISKIETDDDKKTIIVDLRVEYYFE
jgi:hypothetical protein